MNENPNRAEAERLLGVAEKLLQSRDFNGTRDFAVLAQETEPLLEGSDQILAVADVILSSEKRINNHHDWYAILQIDHRSDDQDLLKKQYRRLALLLHPDKNKFPFADQAFKLVADAWAVLSDSAKKELYDNELSLFSKVDIANSSKLPVRRSQRPASKKHAGESVKTTVTNRNSSADRMKLSSFWTACPYCYILYEYPRVYQDCCLRCQKCQRAFHAVLIPSLPPLVPGRNAYYCCWGFFPLGFTFGNSESGAKSSGSGPSAGFPNWMPPIFGPGQQGSDKNDGIGTTSTQPPAFTTGHQVGDRNGSVRPAPTPAPVQAQAPTPVQAQAPTPTPTLVSSGVGRGGGVVGSGNVFGQKKRGRPRKYPLQNV